MPEDSFKVDTPIRRRSSSIIIPATPETLHEFEQNDSSSPFAHLVPINRAARLAFETTVDAIKQDPSGHAHFRRNILIEPAHQESISVASDFTDSEASETEGQSDAPSYRFKGHFCFRLDNPPRVPRIGWILGDGRSSAAKQIDFLLSAPRQVKDISGKHVIISFHPRSCRLVLQARHKTTMQAPDRGGTTVELSKSDMSVELGARENIQIGDCIYLFEYLPYAKSETHEQQLSQFMKQTYGSNWEGLLNLLPSSPEATPVRLHTYTWSLGAFAKGSFGQVTAGTGGSGNPVAIKRLFKPREEEISAHRRSMGHIGKHPNIVQLLDCYSGRDANISEAYCIYQPLACTSLHDIRGQKELSITTQVTLFHHCLNGLAFLHDKKGLMHRDIKPSNLGIVTLDPPVGVIFDLDSATFEETSDDHMQGTLGFLAPEIVALKQWDTSKNRGVSPSSYGRKVDVWALGLSAYTTYADLAVVNQCITPRVYRYIQLRLQQESQFQVNHMKMAYAKIMLQMLCWDVNERLSAANAIEAFQVFENQMNENVVEDTKIGMKRPYTSISPSVGDFSERQIS